MLPQLIDREREIRELRALAGRPGPALALLYGRRRVGKTYLLSHLWPEVEAFYYLAADTSEGINRAGLLRDLAGWLGQDLRAEDFPTWRSVFRLLAQIAADRPTIAILDEFQYLMGTEDDIVSQLVAVWDREVGDRDLTLVLCGSEVSTMEALALGGAPLYGRIDWSVRLHPFDFRDAARMLPGRPPREQAYLYGILGGTPRFLAAVGPRDRIEERISQVLLSPRGEIHLQLENLILQERGIRDPRDYQAVLEAAARGHTDSHRIAQAVGLEDRPHVVRRALEVLEDLDLVRRERNLGASPRTPWRIRLADPAVRFWYRFVHPRRSQLERGHEARVWRERVAPMLDDHMGHVFEQITRQAFERHHERWGLSPASDWSRWEGQDRNRRSIEVDVAAELDDGSFLTGEVKWSSSPVDYDLHLGHVRDLEALAASGQGWAAEALGDRSAGRLYVSAAGFTPYFRERVEADPRIRLVDLEEVYA